MKQNRFRANATEINKAPRRVRYVFIVTSKDDRVTSFVSYQTLAKVIESEITVMKVADIYENKIQIVKNDMIDSLREDWRNNYFDFYWDIPVQYLL